MNIDETTIAAIATARGRSALAIVRLSGPATQAIAARVLSPWPLVERRATLCAIRRPGDATVVERGIATLFRAPASFTGEDTLEITTHGGHAAPLAVLSVLLEAGARQAAPGEFTRRAVLGGRLDLVQAEAIGDLIDARTDAMRRVALRQADGSLSRRFETLRRRILEIEALLAYEIDFPDEDDGPLERPRISAAVEELRAEIEVLLATAPAAVIARDGAVVVLAGPPNAGKSSLFNALLGEARAIVTDVPGTTRDAIEEVVEHAGWPLRLVDTAGLRAVNDPVERLGVEISERYIGGADLVLACSEEQRELPALASRLREITGARVIPVLTKSDHHPAEGGVAGVSETSARSGRGLRELLDQVVAELEATHGHGVLDAPLLTRERHTRALRHARAELDAFEQAWSKERLPTVIAAAHLRSAAETMSELTGGIDVEDVLGRLFSTFCIGK